MITKDEAEFQQAKFILDDFNPTTLEDFNQIKRQSDGKIKDSYWERYKLNKVKDILAEEKDSPYKEEFLIRKKIKLSNEKDLDEEKIGRIEQEIRSDLDKIGVVWNSSKQEINDAIENHEKPFKEKLDKIRQEVIYLLLSKQRDETTEKVVNFLEKENFIYTTKDDVKSEMWIYQDGIYMPNGESEMRRLAREILGIAYSTHLFNEIINKIKADTYIDRNTFFDSHYANLIPLKNGILDIYTETLEPYSPSKIFFSKIPVYYNKEAKCPKIEQFFKDILKEEEDIKVIYELLGYSLLKENKFESAFMFVGNGRNGKSKTLDLFKHFIGVENTCSIQLQNMTHDNSALCEMFNRYINIAGDLSNEDFKDTGMFKQITGRDIIQAKRKFLIDLKFVPFAKNIFSCNELPRVYDTSMGFWSRWVLLEFPFTFINEEDYQKLTEEEKKKHKIKDEDILYKLTSEEELSGLLNEALQGFYRLLLNKKFSSTKGTKEVKDFWIRKSNSLIAFCSDSIEESYDSFISKKEFRKVYGDYCKKHTITPLSDKIIHKVLEEHYNVTESKKEIMSEFISIWAGIKFRVGISR